MPAKESKSLKGASIKHFLVPNWFYDFITELV